MPPHFETEKRIIYSQKVPHAAETELSAKGYAGARMQGIADRAGVKKELLYRFHTS